MKRRQFIKLGAAAGISSVNYKERLMGGYSLCSLYNEPVYSELNPGFGEMPA
jgi:hypothetical protein